MIVRSAGRSRRVSGYLRGYSRGYGEVSPGGIFELPSAIALVGGGVLVAGILAFVVFGGSK